MIKDGLQNTTTGIRWTAELKSAVFFDMLDDPAS